MTCEGEKKLNHQESKRLHGNGELTTSGGLIGIGTDSENDTLDALAGTRTALVLEIRKKRNTCNSTELVSALILEETLRLSGNSRRDVSGTGSVVSALGTAE